MAHEGRRAFTLYGLGALFLLAGFSQAKLHTFESRDTILAARQTNRYTLKRTDFARRGKILSADGRVLAQDQDAFELNVEFGKVPHSNAFFADLAAATGIPASEFAQLASDGVSHRSWRRPMSPAQADDVSRVKASWRVDGLSVARTGRREYPLAAAGAGVVGLVRDGKPLLGLEVSQNDTLTGQNGLTVGLFDRKGGFLPMRKGSASRARADGGHIELTIDSHLQEEATEAIRKAVETNKADDGVAIVLDPKTGNVLAMANWPTFSPVATDGTEPDLSSNSGYNPATMAVLEPGSTFKILTLAQALDAGKARVGDLIRCGGALQINKHSRIRCDEHGGPRAHGVIDPETAIAKSCNVAAASWSLRVGYSGMVKFIEDLGLLERTGLSLPGEARGQFNYGEYAKTLQLATVGFGQSLSTTPIGLASALGALANDGVRMPPRLIGSRGGVQTPLSDGVAVVSPAAARSVLQIMEAVVQSDEGTGKTLRIPGYRLAGKTGTAQKIGSGTGYVSNFVGYVPARSPRAVVLVMVNNPKSGLYYGASVAGPAFRSVAQAVIRRLEIPATEPLPVRAPISKPAATRPKGAREA